MTTEQESTALVPVQEKGLPLNKTAKASAIAGARAAAGGYVPHLGLTEVRAMAEAVSKASRNGERDRLLILTLFDGCLRVSEALALRPKDIKRDDSGCYLEVFGKGKRPGVAAISPSLAAELYAYAYRKDIGLDDRLFPIKRARAFQVVELAMYAGGVSKPDHVGACHVLRHSGAIERLKVTGNPKAVQEQLRHSTAQMTLRYLKTLSAEEALRIQEQVDFRW
jgi:integrase